MDNVRKDEIEPLPGDRQGTSGAGAGRDSMRNASGRVLRRRAPVIQQSTAHDNEEELPPSGIEGEPDPPPGQRPGRRTVRAAPRRNETSGRIKWSREMNIDVIQTYLRVNDCRDDPLPGWRQKLFTEFARTHPELNITEQNLADRKNVIIKKNYLTQLEIDTLRREAGAEIHNEEVRQQVEEDMPKGKQADNNAPDRNDSHVEDSREVVGEGPRQKLHDNFLLFRDSNPLTRPIIPRLKIKKDTQRYIKSVDTELKLLIDEQLCSNLNDIHTTLYAGAVTVIELNDQKLQTQRQNKNTQGPRRPTWKMRLEKQIEQLRTEANIIREYLTGNNSRKVKYKIRKICRRKCVDLNDPQIKEKLTNCYDDARQKSKVKGARLRRYNEITKRKEQNQLFSRDQKIFYRNLESNNQTNAQPVEIDKNNFSQFWQSIWSNPARFNQSATWLQTTEQSVNGLGAMQDANITLADVEDCVKKTSNWKAPGPDHIQNFWLKSFPALFPHFARAFNKILDDPTGFPQFLGRGVTYLLPKKGDLKDPKNYRPITCLSVVYKLLTSVLHKQIYKHCETNNIINPEQRGCVKRSLGCKEQLIIDEITIKQAEVKRRNISMAYIDYKKAFDSVPHDWLIKVLEIYRVNPTIIRLLTHAMTTWETQAKIGGSAISNIKIRRGIYQGDSLSPLWFCLALNPLSAMLNDTAYGFRLDLKEGGSKLSHLLFMDDIKLYAENPKQLKSLITNVKTFSDDIQMAFGLDKCAEVHVTKGKLTSHAENTRDFEQMSPEETYKYLGIQQNNRIDHTQLKKEFRAKYKQRLSKLLHTKLNARNMIIAINTYAVPSLTYSFGILKYSDTDLAELDRMTRTMLTKFRMHHPKSAVERLYIPRTQGGRGLSSIQKICRTQEKNMRSFFYNSDRIFIRKLVECDNGYSPLNLKDRQHIIMSRTNEDHQTLWQDKVLHGKYPRALNNPEVDKESSLLWLKEGRLHPETEGFITAIQDRIIRTRNYEKHILKVSGVNDICRKCKAMGETIEHVIAGCPTLAPGMYLGRHNEVAKILHRELALKFRLLSNPPPFYKYTPSAVLENDETLLYWDRPIQSDRTLDHNRPDILMIRKKDKKATIIDIGCPLTSNLQKTEMEKISKYENLAIELRHVWRLEEVRTIPIIISATGIVTNKLSIYLEQLNLPRALVKIIQRTVILQTCHITRKFLNVE